MHKQKDNKHEFALFYPGLSSHKKEQTIHIVDPLLVRRIQAILRLKVDDSLTLFNSKVHAAGVLVVVDKKSISFLVEVWKDNNPLQPNITVLLPILKRDALDSALYFCAALGANTIQLIMTEKGRSWNGQKEYERLERVIHAAAEQSKHFAFPVIEKPCTLNDALKKYQAAAIKLFADPTGASLLPVLTKRNVGEDFLLAVGPEGDLVTQEKELLKQEMKFCALTPTILRTEHALAVFLGTIRSIVV